MKTSFEKTTSLSHSPAIHAAQRGMALVFALVVLLILTILGVSSLRTSSLQQLMAGNTQEQTRAFEAADSGLSRALNDINTNPSWKTDPTQFNDAPYPYTIQTGTTIADLSAARAIPQTPTPTPTITNPTPPQIGPAPRGSAPSGSTVCVAYYDQEVIGTTSTLSQVKLHQGFTNSGAPCPAGP